MAMTWSDSGQGAVAPGGLAVAQSRKAVCESGTETFAAAATDGASLASASGWDVYIEADDGQLLSGTGSVLAYQYSDSVARWFRAPEFDIAVPAAVNTNRGYYPLAGSPGKGVPVLSQKGRIGYAPSGVGVDAGGLTIFIDVYAAFTVAGS
jgi:hypothetical protein